MTAFMRSKQDKFSILSRKTEREKTYRLLEVSNEIVAILVLLKTGERHLRTGNVLEAEDVNQPEDNA